VGVGKEDIDGTERSVIVRYCEWVVGGLDWLLFGRVLGTGCRLAVD